MAHKCRPRLGQACENLQECSDEWSLINCMAHHHHITCSRAYKVNFS